MGLVCLLLSNAARAHRFIDQSLCAATDVSRGQGDQGHPILDAKQHKVTHNHFIVNLKTRIDMSTDGFSDLRFFSLLMKEGSMAAAAQQMGITPPAVSRRLAQMEHRLGVRLLHRTTRRISLTPEGEMYLLDGARILGDLEALERTVAGAQSSPRGLLKLAATLGFGRTHIAPAISAFAHAYPEVEVQLHLTDRPVNLVEHGFDAAIRFGDLPDSRLTARQLMANHRVLCASPAYLASAGEPTQPSDLVSHQCIVIRESDETYGTWHFRRDGRQETVKVRGMLSTNDGAAATTWALAGHGILIRSSWDVGAYLQSGALQMVLPDWSLPAADIKLVYPTKSHLSAKTRALADFLVIWFADVTASASSGQ